jgi:hypothetical protein
MSSDISGFGPDFNNQGKLHRLDEQKAFHVNTRAPLRRGFFTEANALYAFKSRGFGGEIGVGVWVSAIVKNPGQSGVSTTTFHL